MVKLFILGGSVAAIAVSCNDLLDNSVVILLSQDLLQIALSMTYM